MVKKWRSKVLLKWKTIYLLSCENRIKKDGKWIINSLDFFLTTRKNSYVLSSYHFNTNKHALTLIQV